MNTNNERSGKSDSKRQRLRVSIRFILIAMAILCVFLAYFRRYRLNYLEKQHITSLIESHDGHVDWMPSSQLYTYDHQYNYYGRRWLNTVEPLDAREFWKGFLSTEKTELHVELNPGTVLSPDELNLLTSESISSLSIYNWRSPAIPFCFSSTTQYIQIENYGDALTENLLTIRPTKASWIVVYCDTFTAEQLKILSQLSAAKFLSLNAWVESPTADAIRQLKGIRALEHLDLGGFEELQYLDVVRIVDSMPKLTDLASDSHAMNQSELEELTTAFPKVNFYFSSPEQGEMLVQPGSCQFAPKQ